MQGDIIKSVWKENNPQKKRNLRRKQFSDKDTTNQFTCTYAYVSTFLFIYFTTRVQQNSVTQKKSKIN